MRAEGIQPQILEGENNVQGGALAIQRLLTSREDYFKRAIRSTSTAWRAAGIEHDFEELPGPHDYPFNRGPGAIEMLLWHDRLLARA